MNLSEAIRLGDALPQMFGTYFTMGCVNARLAIIATCALGGALEAVEGIPIIHDHGDCPHDVDPNAMREHIFHRLLELFPTLPNISNGCPVADNSCHTARDHDNNPNCCHPVSFFDLIAHLNDQHRWGRTAIADHLVATYNL
jgi:hypothetical protein